MGAIQARGAGSTTASGKIQRRVHIHVHLQQANEGSGRGSKSLPAAWPIGSWLRESPREAPWSTVNLRPQQGGEWRPGTGDAGMTAARL
ncbi:hypothetical protein DL770_006796 [Monosporascus sp. CRB-9-2]|nr:hypothetical protein DL770_006796 [Monosporascus sp. CRB-9-2]